jgi:hypothetical protein
MVAFVNVFTTKQIYTCGLDVKLSQKKILLFMKYFSSLVCNKLTLKGCLFSFFILLCSNVTFHQTSQTIVENNPIEIVSVKNEI